MRSDEAVAERTPEQVARVEGSFTGRYLAPLLERAAERESERVAAE